MGRHSLTLAALLAALSAAGASEPPQEKSSAGMGDVLDIRAGRMQVRRLEDGRTEAFLSEGIVVRSGEFEVKARRAVLWRRQNEVGELYAEGRVLYRRGGESLRAERLYLDFAKSRAVIIDLRARRAGTKLNLPFQIRAREARMTTRGRLEAEELSLSTCTYGVPHYHVAIDRALLVGEDPRPPRDEFDLFPFETWSLEMERIAPEIGPPIFFLPALVVGPWVRNVPLRSLSIGRTSRYGTFVLSEWGRKFKLTDEEGKERTWCDVVIEADWRQKRGGGTGLDIDYGWKDYNGYLDTYFLYDQGRDPHVSFDAKFPPLEREERGRARFFHRHELDEARHWRFELEASYVSDRHLLEEFFEKEFKEDKAPESAVYLRWLDGNTGAYALQRHRINDFQTQNEYLPRMHFAVLHEPVVTLAGATVYFTERFDVANIRRRFDEDTGLPSERAWRVDAVSDLTMPCSLWGVATLTPFVEHRLTVYEEDLEEDTEFRSLPSSGARLSTQVHGNHPWFAWEFVGLRGLRHVAHAEARYAHRADNNVETADLFPFDEVDLLDEFEEVAFEMRHRFATRDEKGERVDLLDAGAEIEYYPEFERDAIPGRVSNYMPPFNWIPLAPDTVDRVDWTRRWSNVHWDFEFSPLKCFRLYGEGEYNQYSRHEEMRRLRAAFTPYPGLSIGATNVYIRDIADAYTASVTWRPTEKWSVTVAGQYDDRREEFLRRSLMVSRDYHDFLIQAVLESDRGRDERRFFITVVPKFLGRGPSSRTRREDSSNWGYMNP